MAHPTQDMRRPLPISTSAIHTNNQYLQLSAWSENMEDIGRRNVCAQCASIIDPGLIGKPHTAEHADGCPMGVIEAIRVYEDPNTPADQAKRDPDDGGVLLW